MSLKGDKPTGKRPGCFFANELEYHQHAGRSQVVSGIAKLSAAYPQTAQRPTDTPGELLGTARYLLGTALHDRKTARDNLVYMKDLTPDEEATPLKAIKALEAVLLFHSASPWDDQKRLEWAECVAFTLGTKAKQWDASTRTLCDMARAALGRT